jgi:tetratricopeptide repeat protein
VRLRLARYFGSTGRTAQAQEQARRILAIDPDNAEARQLVR